MTWSTWASNSRRPSDTKWIGLESSKVDAAAAQQSRRRIDATKLTRAISQSLSLCFSADCGDNREFDVVLGLCIRGGANKLEVWSRVK